MPSLFQYVIATQQLAGHNPAKPCTIEPIVEKMFALFAVKFP